MVENLSGTVIKNELKVMEEMCFCLFIAQYTLFGLGPQKHFNIC